MALFRNIFYNILKEDMTSTIIGGGGAASVNNTTGLTKTDGYAPGDHRLPHILGDKNKKKGKKGKKRKIKALKRPPIQSLIPTNISISK